MTDSAPARHRMSQEERISCGLESQRVSSRIHIGSRLRHKGWKVIVKHIRWLWSKRIHNEDVEQKDDGKSDSRCTSDSESRSAWLQGRVDWVQIFHPSIRSKVRPPLFPARASSSCGVRRGPTHQSACCTLHEVSSWVETVSRCSTCLQEEAFEGFFAEKSEGSIQEIRVRSLFKRLEKKNSFTLVYWEALDYYSRITRMDRS